MDVILKKMSTVALVSIRVAGGTCGTNKNKTAFFSDARVAHNYW
jgi:hypothetical protein